MYKKFISFVREIYGTDAPIPLHAPHFTGKEKEYVLQTIDSTFVSSVGEFVNQFESEIAQFVGAKYAIATGNGTGALHIALKVAGVGPDDEVITQPLTFVATCNAINYCGAIPVFVDVDLSTMGLSAEKLESFLRTHTRTDNKGRCINKASGRVIKACLPVHTFGHPVEIETILAICQKYNIILIEDAAEALGSYYRNKHTGTFGLLSAFSFNGNKVITTGGGGMIVTDDESLAGHAKHLTTTAKSSHGWEYFHDEVGYNYRLPNINAALGCAQLEHLPAMLANKRQIASRYEGFFKEYDGITFVKEQENSEANYWLNTVILKDKKDRDTFLEETNRAGVMTRPIWTLMTKLPMFKNCQQDDMQNALWLEERIINIPSSVSP